MRSFMFLSVNGRLYHAYFEPERTYFGRFGNLWITESPHYFPVIEKRIHDKHGVQYDFGHDTFYGQPIDNNEVRKGYIGYDMIIK